MIPALVLVVKGYPGSIEAPTTTVHLQYRAEVTYQDPRVEGRGWRVTRVSTFVNEIAKKY